MSYFIQESSTINNYDDWMNLRSLVYSLFQELDDSGLSQIMGDVIREFNRDILEFSYVQAKGFRDLEENLAERNTDNIDWNTFWHFIDEHKKRAIHSFTESGRDYKFSRNLFPLLETIFENAPNKKIEMSPRKWKLGALVSIGTFLGLIDGSASIPTFGVSLLSYLGASVAAGYGAIEALENNR